MANSHETNLIPASFAFIMTSFKSCSSAISFTTPAIITISNVAFGLFFNSSGKTYIGSDKNYINYTKWEPNVWYNLKAEFDFENQIIDLFFNNKFVITVSIPKDIRWADLVKFEFNNTYTGFKFDNLKITDLENLELNEYNNTKTSIYPNPTTDYININSSEKNNTIKITDLTGKVIFNGINTNKIDVTHLIKGVYIIHIKTNKEEFIQKIIKK